MADQYTVTARHTTGLEFAVDNGTVEITAGPAGHQPTELLLAGLGSCMLSTLVDYAQRNKIDADEITVTVSGEMESRPRRIARIKAVFHLPTGLSQTHADALVRAAHRCTVHTTLSNPPEMTVTVDRSDSAAQY